MYRVTFDDRSYVDVSSGHLWTVRGRQERRKGLGTWRTLETIELLRLGVKRPNGKAQARQWEIPVQGPAQFESRPVAVDPYVMGVWLGDGTKGVPSYGKPVPEIAEKVTACGYAVTARADGVQYYLRGAISQFRQYDVFQRGSHERYVPEDYKFNDVATRRAVLAGLLDSDGEVHKAGSIGYCSTSKQLVEDVIWLARSLGYKAMMQPTPKQGRCNGEDKRVAYRCTINASDNPFTHPAKRLAYKPSEPRYTKRWIESIEPLPNADGMCVSVSNDDGLYLADDFIVTHNSAITAWLILWAMSTRPHLNGVVTANTLNQLSTKTWRELAVWHKRAINASWFQWTATRFSHVAHPETWFVAAVPQSEHNSEAFAGLHARYVLIIFDEASAIPDSIWEVTMGAMTTPGAIWVVAGNGTRNTGRFRECFGSQRHRWTTRSVDSRTARKADKKYLQTLIDDYGLDSDFVKVRVLGQFPKASDTQFIPVDTVERAMTRTLNPRQFAGFPRILGVDVARFGSDQSVIICRQGTKAFDPQTYRQIDLMELAGRVAEAYRELLPETVIVDETGLGGGVVDRLKQLGIPVVGVNFGAQAAVDPGAYANMRAEIWGQMRSWLQGEVDIPNMRELRDDLVGVEYGYDGKMRIQLERKDKMRERGLASPDIGDALALTFASYHRARAIAQARTVQPRSFGSF